MKKPILVVMAAGMGSRYGGLKQIDPVGPCGEAILDYSLYDARRAGFSTVVFIIKHEIEAEFKRTVGARAGQAGLEVRYAFQQLDTAAGGLCGAGRPRQAPGAPPTRCCRRPGASTRPLRSSTPTTTTVPACFRLIFDYLSTHMPTAISLAWAMAGFRLENTVSENGSVSRGVCVTDAGGASWCP